MKKTALLLLPLIIFLCGPVSAEFYKYTDQDGNVRFTDDLSKVPRDQRPNVTSYEESQSTSPIASPAEKPEPDQSASEQKSETDTSIDALYKQIKNKQDDLEKEYKAILKEKARLETEANKEKSVEETVEFNREIKNLNERIVQHQQKSKALNTEIEAYNARMAKDKKDQEK